ncbi:MAG: Isoprenylcysteine carboxyl methyltransferase [Firmicutes bacterium]|nr:Isoprenylcysteine carboxyl methyltransferase [Bacillota bacterium]
MVVGDSKHQRFRFIVSGMVTVFLIVIVVRTIMMLFISSDHLLWGIPVIAISLLDIYFLTRSLVREPKSIDTRLSTGIISLGATFGFSLVAVSIADPQLEFPHMQALQQMGRFLSILPYPFVLWALLCLKDCLTIVPEAHTVVAHGIYKYSRHPLYVCYIVWAIANIMIFPSLSMMIGSIGQIIFLIVRLRREEQLLLNTFPKYGDYYQRTGLCGNMYRGTIPSVNR